MRQRKTIRGMSVEEFSGKLKAFREEKGWKQDEMARRIGCLPVTLMMWEAGLRFPNEMSLIAIERVVPLPESEASLEEKSRAFLEELKRKDPALFPEEPKEPTFEESDPERFWMSVGLRLKTFRSDARRLWSQTELAETMGLTNVELCRVENGHKPSKRVRRVVEEFLRSVDEGVKFKSATQAAREREIEDQETLEHSISEAELDRVEAEEVERARECGMEYVPGGGYFTIGERRRIE